MPETTAGAQFVAGISTRIERPEATSVAGKYQLDVGTVRGSTYQHLFCSNHQRKSYPKQDGILKFTEVKKYDGGWGSGSVPPLL